MLQGCIDVAERHRLSGWVREDGGPGGPVSLLITVEGQLLARVLADRHRDDLAAAGIGRGRHAFDVWLRQPLSPLHRHVIHVQREGDGLHCPGSPLVIEPAAEFDPATQADLAARLAALDDDDALHAFLAREIERLRQRRAERQTMPGLDKRRGARALVIDATAPDSSRDAGSNAILSHMAALRRLGYEVAFAASDMAHGPSSAMIDAGIEICGRPWYASVEEVLARQANGFDLVYLHREPVASRYLALVRHHMPQARLVFSVADLHHLRLARQAAIEDRPDIAVFGRQVQLREMLAAWSADAVITHSSHEAALLQAELPAGRVHVVPWTIPVRPVAAPFAGRRGVAFVGSFDHAPNLDAAYFLLEDVMPRVWARDPSIPCILAGSRMPDALLRMASDRIIVLGRVHDLASVFGQVRLTVAPLRFGAGIKGKVLASLAAGVPCVVTSVAAEGLDLPPALTDMVADDAPGLAERIVRLHQGCALSARHAAVGLAYVAKRLSEPAIDRLLGAAVGHGAAVGQGAAVGHGATAKPAAAA